MNLLQLYVKVRKTHLLTIIPIAAITILLSYPPAAIVPGMIAIIATLFAVIAHIESHKPPRYLFLLLPSIWYLAQIIISTMLTTSYFWGDVNPKWISFYFCYQIICLSLTTFCAICTILLDLERRYKQGEHNDHY